MAVYAISPFILAAADHKKDGGRRFQIDSPSLSNLVVVVIREQVKKQLVR